MTNGYLNLPAMPAIDRGPTAAQITAIAGADLAAPFTARETARSAAEDALADLKDHRPGGRGWKAAADADVAALTAGKKATEIAKLIDAEPKRYGQALAAVAIHQQTANALRADLDEVLLKGAVEVAKAEARVEWAKIANQAWGARADHTKTWQLYRDGHRQLGLWRAADEIAAWLEARPTRPQDPATWRREHQLPADRYARGAWLCVELILNPSETWWHLPKPEDVEWPLDGWPLVEKAIQPSAVHAVHGGGEVSHQPAGSSSPQSKRPADQLAWDLGISA